MLELTHTPPGSPAYEAHVRSMRKRVFDHMLRTRGWKYRAFLRYLRLFRYAAFAPTRGEFLESYYTLMRYLDDVVDGDVPLAKGYVDESEYITEKIAFAENPVHPGDEADYLMLYCFRLAEKFGQDFQSETNDILTSLLFDARRRGKNIIFSKADLMHHFHLLDIRGTIRATLKIFKDDPDKYTLLEPLGTACRHQFDIEDFDTDIAAGYINISKEDCDHFGISASDLQNSSSPQVRNWLQHHAAEGLRLLDRHHEIMPQGKFSILEKATFKFVYELPARNVFMKTLSKDQDK